MRLVGSLEKAKAIKPGQHAKARDLHYDIENELEHGLYDEDEDTEAQQALAHLERSHPGVKEASRAVTRPPKLSRSATERLGAEDRPERVTEADRREFSGENRRPPAGARPTRRATRASAPRRAAGRALDLASDATGGWGELIGELFLWGIGLSIAYLLLTHDTGVSKLFQGLTTVTRGVVSPVVDPLNPKGAI